MVHDAAMPAMCCSSLIIIVLIFSLKSLGHIDGPMPLVSPALRVACF